MENKKKNYGVGVIEDMEGNVVAEGIETKMMFGEPRLYVYGSVRPRRCETASLFEKEIVDGIKAYVAFDASDALTDMLDDDISAKTGVENGGKFGMTRLTVPAPALLKLGYDLEELWDKALKNTCKEGMYTENFKDYLVRVTGRGDNLPDIPGTLVATLARDMYGAAILCNDKVLKDMHDLMGDYFIIPSSRHEVIIISKECNIPADILKEWVGEVNRMVLRPEDILSDKVFAYDDTGLHVAG